MYASLDLIRLPLGPAQRELARVSRRDFAAGASFSRLLLPIRLESMPWPVPLVRTVGFFAVWPDLGAVERFRTGPLRPWTAAKEHLALTLRPLQSFGTWSGGDPLDGPHADPGPGPVLLLTHSRTRLRRVPVFAATDGPVVRSLRRAEGQIWATGFMDGVRSNDTGTLSLWRSSADATRFAYAPGVHQDAVKAQRRGGWFSESWFARFALSEASGSWRGLEAPAMPAGAT
ncbi:MAG TPA: hypothetical protein VF081_13630 [Solirubrobacterales bacterium]